MEKFSAHPIYSPEVIEGGDPFSATTGHHLS